MLERFSVSLDADLLQQFDVHIRNHGYTNRSEAVRDLLRKVLVRETWEQGGPVVGVISLVYDHHQRQLQDKLTDIQHDNHHLIVSTTHIHLNHDDCLEVIVVRGNSAAVRAMADALIALRGVKSGDLMISHSHHGAAAGS
jgi:CopG family transcriptional regulator, nickel-responsive regulator